MSSLSPTNPSTTALSVRPGRPLTGAIRVDGSKNAALPLIAAAAVTSRTVHVERIPRSTDVQVMLALLREMGHVVTKPVSSSDDLQPLEADKVDVTAPSHPNHVPDLRAAATIRASYYLVPVLLQASGRASMPWPGGCSIGDRGMDQHFKVYEQFGDKVRVREDGYEIRRASGPVGRVTVDLPFRSRGASVAAVLRAAVADCPLTLRNPNTSPEFSTVLAALGTAGWEVSPGTELIHLTPPATRPGAPLTWEIPGDKIEAATLACAVAATGGRGLIEGIVGADVGPVVAALRGLGILVESQAEAMYVQADPRTFTGRPLRAVASLDPAGLDADFEPPLMALALGMPGAHLFSDAINPGRHGNLLAQLGRLGATIEPLTPTECRLTGPQRLTGATVDATDIRTGSALLIAALTAHGTTVLRGLNQLRRGHADLPAKLRSLGADITEVSR
ncbi:UDP-N-acetylglucosamine 1-carboxyvinyltransferase [Kitasatospora purpeofusca]|uniref:UDP-N-acetylglucosamine 1-carboxyvinyltransferase n=1 Tax=Kitasatospora purpeofusca TaxID=67352 RepID=UPI00365A53A5